MDTDKMLQEIRAELRRLTESLERPMPRQRLYSRPDAARVLGISLTKLKSWVERKVILTVRPDGEGHPMVPLSEIERVCTLKDERPVRKASCLPPAGRKSTAEMLANVRAELKKRRGR